MQSCLKQFGFILAVLAICFMFSNHPALAQGGPGQWVDDLYSVLSLDKSNSVGVNGKTYYSAGSFTISLVDEKKSFRFKEYKPTVDKLASKELHFTYGDSIKSGNYVEWVGSANSVLTYGLVMTSKWYGFELKYVELGPRGGLSTVGNSSFNTPLAVGWLL
jgi:hypothetical protein